MTAVDYDEIAVLFDESFSRAADALGVVDQSLTIADRRVAIRYAGTAMSDTFRRPFTHLQGGNGGEPELTVLAWDSAESTTPPPPLPTIPPKAEAGHRTLVKSNELRVEYQIGPGMLTAIAPRKGRAWVWIADRSAVPIWEAAAPFKMIWKWWLAGFGHTMLHAGAVAHGNGGALFVGSGGRGKSTATIACLEAGFDYVGDDYVVLDDDGETIHSIYCTAKLEDDHAGRFTRSASTDIGLGMGGPGAGQVLRKRVLLLTEAFPQQVTSKLSIGTVAAMRLGLERPDSRFESFATARAMLAMSASSMIQLADSGPADLASMARLVERMPTFSLVIGNKTGQIPSVVEAMIRESTHA